MIRKTPKGYVIKSKSGAKTLSKPYATKAAAAKRLRQIEFFKRRGKR
jgi:hypothetical protein